MAQYNKTYGGANFNFQIDGCFLYFIKIEGTIMPPDGPDEWPQNNNKRQWLVFYRANGLKLAGVGLLDGKGEKWWTSPVRYVCMHALVYLVFFFYESGKERQQ